MVTLKLDSFRYMDQELQSNSPIDAAGGAQSGILTWHRGYRDPVGGAPRVRPFHCTQVGLTLAIAPNVGDSGA